MKRYMIGLFCCAIFSAAAETTLSTPKPAWEDVTVQDWKQSNEVVRKKGGWRVYLNEALPQADQAMPLVLDKPKAEEKVE